MDERTQGRANWVMEALALYEGPLVAYAARYTRDVHSARDAVQEAFLRLCGEDEAGVGPHVKAWLFTVVRRLAVDAKRKERRMDPAGEAVIETSAGREADPADTVETRDAASHVLRLVSDLPESQRECLHLKFGCGLMYREIAEVTGLSVGNVGFLIHTGLTTLRARLAPERRRVVGEAR